MALNLRNPNGYDGQPATHTKQGIVRLATDAEITAGTADNVAVTPAQLSSSVPVPLTVPLGGTGLTTITDHGVMVGSGAGAVTPVATSATAGVPLVSAGAAADPAFGTAVVAGGGTGVTSATAYAVLTGGTTATGAFQSIASVGAAGEVLTSNGAGALPTFQAVPAADFSSPPPIGDVAPNTGAFTTLSTNGSGTVTLTSSTNVGITASSGTVTLTASSRANVNAPLGLLLQQSNLSFNNADQGVVNVVTSASGAAASPIVANARSVSLTFTSVSIAAGADLTLTNTNSSIVDVNTRANITMYGATTGSALSIKSVTFGSGTVAIVVTNGTGATTSTEDINIVMQLLN